MSPSAEPSGFMLVALEYDNQGKWERGGNVRSLSEYTPGGNIPLGEIYPESMQNRAQIGHVKSFPPADVPLTLL